MLTPKPLFPGARVALLSASAPVPQARLAPALQWVSSLGLEPVPFPSCFAQNRWGYLAAPDAQRAADLNAAFSDPSIDGIWCIRGGYGAHRILPLLDYPMISAHPKWFGGYSDVTALHTALQQLCGFVTYHTIMPSTEYDSADHFTIASLRRVLFGPIAGPLFNPPGHPLEILVPGQVSAPLCGGNLSLLAASLGTPWELDCRNKLLFLEDIGEKTYRVDGMLTQLRNAGKLDQCAGILLGAWTDCLPEHPDATFSLREIFDELLRPVGKPTVMGLACGHTVPTLSLPLGRALLLDAGLHTLEVLPC